MERGSVVSADGTTISYRCVGNSGPKVILVHGGMQASQNFRKLGELLARDFHVYILDRRGRGPSGPYGEGYGIDKDCDDLAAVIAQTQATRVFGLSSGAIIALHTALRTHIDKLAIYEPPLVRDGDKSHMHWAPRFRAEVAANRLDLALTTILKSIGDESLMTKLPRWLLATMCRLGMRDDAKNSDPEYVPIAQLIPTMHYDTVIIDETADSDYASLKADTLLLRGEISAPFLRRIARSLAKDLPAVRELELPGVGHIAADNDEKPHLVAAALTEFFAA